MTKYITRHALTYFGTGGLLLIAISGFAFLYLLYNYNTTRSLDLLHAVAVFLGFALGQTTLFIGVLTYISSRRCLRLSQIPPLPKAHTVALIPAYNEEKTIGHIVTKTKKFVDIVIVLDDGSSDQTAKIAEEAGAIVIRHPHNMGYGAAVRTLLNAALLTQASYAVLLDADGQHDPEDIPKFINALKDGADVAIGNRFGQSKVPRYRKLGIAIIRLFLRILGVKVKDPENGFRAFNRKSLEILLPNLEETWMGISSQTIYLATRKRLRIVEIPVTVRYDLQTASSEPPLLHGLSVIWTIIWTWLTENPYKPLAMGITFLTISSLLLTHAIYIFNTTRYIPSIYISLAVILEILAVMLNAIAITAKTRPT